MRAQAIIRLKFASKRDLDVVLKALTPETAKPTTSRSHVSISGADRVLTLEFEATDTSALRAIVNSYLHWVMLVSDTFSRLKSL